MANFKKKNIGFPIIIDTEPDRVIDLDQVVCEYSSFTGGSPAVPVTDKFENAGIEGSYELMLTIPTSGYYKVHITVPGDDNYVAAKTTHSIQVMDSTIDDVYTEVKKNGGKLDALKTSLDALDVETFNTLDEMVTGIESKLTTLSDLLVSEDDDAITSLKELLNMIKDSGDANSSLLAAIQSYVKDATDDLEKMIRGDEFLTNGDANPFYQNTNVDIMNTLKSMNTFITDTVAAAEKKVSDAVEAARVELVTLGNSVLSTATANKDSLEHDVFGLPAIMTKLQSTDSESKTGIANLAGDIQSLSTAVESFKAGVHSKLDSIQNGVDKINTTLGKTTKTNIII